MTDAVDSPRLMMVNLSRSWGGGEKWMLSVGTALRERGHSVEFIVYPDSVLHGRLSELKIPCHALPLRTLSLLNPAKILQARKLLINRAPDILILNSSHELKTIGWIAHRLKVPEIIFRRGVSYPIRNHIINRWFLRRVVTRFLANSQATFHAFVKAFPFILNKPTLSLNNGIDPRGWTPKRSEMVPARIGCSARLSPEKGVERLILAMAQLGSDMPEAELHIMGTGPEKDKLQALVADHGLEKQVRFVGFVEDVQAQLHSCSIFVFTPHFGEGTSLALIEAMLLELPCVVMDTAAMREVVVDGETGFVVPDGDVKALADRLAQLIQDTGLRDRFGKAGRERALQFFSLAYIVEQVEDWLLGPLK
ncbi:MAG: glycosyltransferase family 4 protein [Bacteroidota bacterium]